MRILVVLGGSVLRQRGEAASASNQRRNVERAATALAELTHVHEVIVTHDSDPETGHLLELALRNRLPGRDVVSVLTQIVVTGEDPEANAIAEIRSLRVLVESGALVICAGGGIPVALDGHGTLHGVEVTIDNDLTAALLARRLDADMLLIATDTEAGSMGLKVEAACRFATTTGQRAAIGSLNDLARVARGATGTQVLAPVLEAAIAAACRAPQNPRTGRG
jgi:carbamate kinase